jgi:hypothetical protein
MPRYKKSNAIMSYLRSVGWVRIIGLSLLGAIGAWFATALAISGVTRTKAPKSALMFMPMESVALSSHADQLFLANPQNPPPLARKLALAALDEQIVNSKALRILGFYADIDGDKEKAEKLIGMAQKFSRREAGAQLWLIENFVQKNNIKQTLVHYDIALRTKPDIKLILYPRLLDAIEDKEIRAALRPYIRGKNDWAEDFLFFANTNSKNLPALVDLVIETRGLPDKEAGKNQSLGLLSRLVSEKHFFEAQRLYLQIPGAKPGRMTNIAFDSTDRDLHFGSMGWRLIENPDAGGSFTGKPGIENTMLSMFANPGTTSLIAHKLLYLKPHSYKFEAQLSNLDRGDGGFLRWQLRCPSDASGMPLWTIDSINKTFKATFTVPENCPVQFFELLASGGKGQTGLEASLTSLSLAVAD